MQHACSLSEAGWESRNSSKRNLSNGRCLVTRFSGSVAHVDLRINFFRYAPVIIVGVIRDDDYAVISAHVIEWHAGEVGYSKTRRDVPRNQCTQVDTINRERRPSTK